jgi:hypothetical protein
VRFAMEMLRSVWSIYVAFPSDAGGRRRPSPTDPGLSVGLGMSADAQPRDGTGSPRSSWDALMDNLENLGRVAAGLAAIVAVLYVVGAVVIGVRLGLRDLPSSAVVAQLPREFLLSTGLNVSLPAPATAVALYVAAGLVLERSEGRLVRISILAGFALVVAVAGYYISVWAGLSDGLGLAVALALCISALLALKRSGAKLVRNSVVLALVVAVASAGFYVLKDPFPAKVCSSAGSVAAVGDFIGETGDRVYVGALRDPEGRRRIASVPLAGVSRVLIGGGAQQTPCRTAQA